MLICWFKSTFQSKRSQPLRFGRFYRTFNLKINIWFISRSIRGHDQVVSKALDAETQFPFLNMEVSQDGISQLSTLDVLGQIDNYLLWGTSCEL